MMTSFSTLSHALIVSGSEAVTEKLSSLLSGLHCAFDCVETCQEAKSRLGETDYDFLIILSPLPDGMGVLLARRATEGQSLSGCLLLVQQRDYEETNRKLSPQGILVLPRTTKLGLIRQSLNLLIATQARVQGFASQTERLKRQVDDVKLVHHAKLLLIEHLNMRESEAHHYIEKQAMDTGRQRRAVAEQILRIYES